MCDFHTIENLGYNNCSIFVQYMSNNIFIENLVYKNHAIIIQFENRLKFRTQKVFNFCIIYSYNSVQNNITYILYSSKT